MKKLIPVLLLAGSTFLAGCGDSQEDFVFTNGTVATSPIARNDAYTTVEDTPVTIAAGQGVLVNDTLNALNVANVTVTFPNTTTQGGTVTLAANSGAFTYTPAAGFTGADTFSYTLANGFATSTATVTITVTAAVVNQGFFVDSANGNDATGDFATGAPFATIQAAIADAGANQDIVVRPGNYTGAITLLDGQRLLGSGSVLAQGVIRPVLSGTVTLADGNTLDFLEFNNVAGRAVAADGVVSGTVTNCVIDGTTVADPFDGAGIGIFNSSGSWQVSNNTIADTGGISINFNVTDSDDLTARVNENDIDTDAGAIGFLTENTADVHAQIHDNSMLGTGLEIIVADDSTLCLDLEDNTTDEIYSLILDPFGTMNSLTVEQLLVITTAKPTGAGNTGTFDDGTGFGGKPLTPEIDGFCGF